MKRDPEQLRKEYAECREEYYGLIRDHRGRYNPYRLDAEQWERVLYLSSRMNNIIINLNQIKIANWGK